MGEELATGGILFQLLLDVFLKKDKCSTADGAKMSSSKPAHMATWGGIISKKLEMSS